MLRVHNCGQSHHFRHLPSMQETIPARTTNSESTRSEHNHGTATECAAVAEGATEVATTASAANEGSPLTVNDGTMPAVENRPARAYRRNQQLHVDGHVPAPLDFDAFRVDTNTCPRNRETGRRKRTRAVDTIVSAVLSTGSTRQQSLVLHKAMFHPAIRQVAESACVREEQICWQKQRENVIKIIEKANLGQARGGRSDSIKSVFVTSLMVALASTEDGLKSNPSLRRQAKSLGLKVSTGWRYLSKGSKKRGLIEDGDETYPSVKKVRRTTRYDAEYKAAVKQWVMHHQFVRVSPIKSDTLKIGEHEEPKLLREISIREMHNDLLRTVEDCGLECARRRRTTNNK